MSQTYTVSELYEAGQLSAYARLLRERKISAELITAHKDIRFAKQATSLSCSRQCVDGPWVFRNIQTEAQAAAQEIYLAGQFSVYVRLAFM